MVSKGLSFNLTLIISIFFPVEQFQVKEFKNLSLIIPLETPEGKNITKVEEFVTNPAELEKNVGKLGDSSAKVCVHESLWQCQSLFNDVQGKVGFKKIIFFTSDDDPHKDDPALRKQALMKAGVS